MQLRPEEISKIIKEQIREKKRQLKLLQFKLNYYEKMLAEKQLPPKYTL